MNLHEYPPQPRPCGNVNEFHIKALNRLVAATLTTRRVSQMIDSPL